MLRTTVTLLLLGSLLHPVRVTFWRQDGGDYNLILKDHLGSDTDRICGTVSKDDAGWNALSFKSNGARTTISEQGLSFDAAQREVERVCK